MIALSTATIAFLLAAAPAEPAPAQEAAVSSAPARAPEKKRAPDAPISVGVILDREGRTQYRADYSMRWDFGDVKGLPGKTRTFLRSPWKPIKSLRRDLYRGSYVGFEGVRVRPERALSQWSPGLFASTDSARGAAGAADGEQAAVSRRRRLSLTPILDDVARQLQEEISRSLIREGFNQALPQAREHGLREKKALLEDIKKLPEAWGAEP